MMTRPVRWSLASTGETISELLAGLERSQRCHVGKWTRESLKRLRIRPKSADRHELVLVKGGELGPARNRRTLAIHREGTRRGLERPSPDAALLFSETLPMELEAYNRIVFMHKPIRDLDQHPSLLCWERRVVGGAERHVLTLLEAYPDTIWPREAVFAFALGADAMAAAQRVVEVRRPRLALTGRVRPCWTWSY